ncbi:MAG TPA: hypothetical protein VI588_03570, partial [Candidatus Gracilibacteria bacterium]|nr:hypothetical protein [Candidatus Gracilibacteria bacterium]
MNGNRLSNAFTVGSIVAAAGCGAPPDAPSQVPAPTVEQKEKNVGDVLNICRNAKRDLMSCLTGTDGKPLALDLIADQSSRVLKNLFNNNEVPEEWISDGNTSPSEIPADVSIEVEMSEMKTISKKGFRFVLDRPLGRQFLPLALMLVDDFIEFADKEEQEGKLKVAKQKPLKIMDLAFVQFEASDKENDPQQYVYNNTFNQYHRLHR